MDQIVNAAQFAALKHRSQRRKDSAGSPYINHPIGVAHILVNEGEVRDPVLIQAALLHDTVEDTTTTLPEIRSRFGEDVAKIVTEVTEDRLKPREEKKRLELTNSASKSSSARMLMLADKLHNLRDLDAETPRGWTEETVQEYFAWSAKVIEGLRGTNKGMERELDQLFRKYQVGRDDTRSVDEVEDTLSRLPGYGKFIEGEQGGADEGKEEERPGKASVKKDGTGKGSNETGSYSSYEMESNGNNDNKDDEKQEGK